MKKIAVSTIAIAAFIVYAVFNHKTQTQPVAVTTGTGKTQSTQSGQAQSSQTSQTTPSTAPIATATSQTYKDGSYTGKAVDAFYGNIQVKAIISGGKITDVQFLQYPNDQQESIQINTEAMPVLTQEAIQTQSAQVDVVSRATDSSAAFNTSLASALDQAK